MLGGHLLMPIGLMMVDAIANSEAKDLFLLLFYSLLLRVYKYGAFWYQLVSFGWPW
jgi:hypothetical protein